MASLKKYVGEDKSRSIKKLAFYTFGIIGAYVVTSVGIFTAQLVHWGSSGSTEWFAWNMSKEASFWMFLLVTQIPWIFWLLYRLWYKYVHIVRYAQTLEQKGEKWKEQLEFQGLKALFGIESRIVRNAGTSIYDEDHAVEVMDEKDAELLKAYKEKMAGRNTYE